MKTSQTSKTELVFILDKSGSMSGLESDTIGGYNAMLKKQQQAPGEARVTTILFDDGYEVDKILNNMIKPAMQKYFKYFPIIKQATVMPVGLSNRISTVRGIGYQLKGGACE